MLKVAPAAVSRMGIMNLLSKIVMPLRHLGRLRMWLALLGPFSEDGCPYADARGALFNGHFEIMRHSDGKHVHGDVREVLAGNLVAQFTKLAKMGASTFGVVGVRRHGHKTLNFQVRPALSCGEDRFDF